MEHFPFSNRLELIFKFLGCFYSDIGKPTPFPATFFGNSIFFRRKCYDLPIFRTNYNLFQKLIILASFQVFLVNCKTGKVPFCTLYIGMVFSIFETLHNHVYWRTVKKTQGFGTDTSMC